MKKYTITAGWEGYSADEDKDGEWVRAEDVSKLARDLIDVMRMPNTEYVADKHNSAVKQLRGLSDD